VTKIQWTDRTTNPIKRQDGGNYCEKISAGCANCYASGLNSKGTRFGGNGLPFGGVRPEARPEMALNIKMLGKWGRMRKPKKHFVGSMTDIGGPWVPDWMIFALLNAMREAPLQTFQILTKRPERLAEVSIPWLRHAGLGQFPKNIWIGISAENQATYDERIKWLGRILAQVRFVSLEPLLGPIEISGPDNPRAHESLDWVIVGGESGPNARPLEMHWLGAISAQCKCYGIPQFTKQMGSHWARRTGAVHGKGGDPDEWPEGLRVRMFPGDRY
jgi:protein gp37